MTRYYECHITLTPDSGLKVFVEGLGWKFSQIFGDIILGDDEIFAYATTHYNEKLGEQEVIAEMNHAASMMEKRGFKVLRQKVELVVYDTKKPKKQ